MARAMGPQRGTSLVPAASIAKMAKYCRPGAYSLPAARGGGSYICCWATQGSATDGARIMHATRRQQGCQHSCELTRASPARCKMLLCASKQAQHSTASGAER